MRISRSTRVPERIKEGAVEDDLLPEAFALVREAAKRVIGERHYDVQLMGGMALEGNMLKWQPGKEKPVLNRRYLNALSGKGSSSLPMTT